MKFPALYNKSLIQFVSVFFVRFEFKLLGRRRRAVNMLFFAAPTSENVVYANYAKVQANHFLSSWL